MKKKVGIIVIIILLFFMALAVKYNYYPESMVERKAAELYGDDYCKKDLEMLEEGTDQKTKLGRIADGGYTDHPTIGGSAMTKWRCSVCGYKGESSSTITPKLCSTCAAISKRCSTCGKRRVPEMLERQNEIKKQRENKINNN